MILTENLDKLTQQDLCLCRCDYCNNYFTRTKRYVIRSHEVITKDACLDCCDLKYNDCIILREGKRKVKLKEKQDRNRWQDNLAAKLGVAVAIPTSKALEIIVQVFKVIIERICEDYTVAIEDFGVFEIRVKKSREVSTAWVNDKKPFMSEPEYFVTFTPCEKVVEKIEFCCLVPKEELRMDSKPIYRPLLDEYLKEENDDRIKS